MDLISTDASIGPVSSGIGIQEMPSGIFHKFKFDVPLSSFSKVQVMNVAMTCDCLGAISLINNKNSEAYMDQEIHNAIENLDVEKL